MGEGMASERTKILRAVNEIHASSLERCREICIAGKGAREATSSMCDSLDGALRMDRMASGVHGLLGCHGVCLHQDGD